MRFWKKQLRIGVWQLACICQPAAWELQNIFLIQTFRRIFQLRCCLNIFIIECVSNWIDETFRFDMRIVINVLVLDVTKSNFDSCLCQSNLCKISFYDAKNWQTCDDAFEIDTCLINEAHIVMWNYNDLVNLGYDVNLLIIMFAYAWNALVA